MLLLQLFNTSLLGKMYMSYIQNHRYKVPHPLFPSSPFLLLFSSSSRQLGASKLLGPVAGIIMTYPTVATNPTTQPLFLQLKIMYGPACQSSPREYTRPAKQSALPMQVGYTALASYFNKKQFYNFIIFINSKTYIFSHYNLSEIEVRLTIIVSSTFLCYQNVK